VFKTKDVGLLLDPLGFRSSHDYRNGVVTEVLMDGEDKAVGCTRRVEAASATNRYGE